MFLGCSSLTTAPSILPATTLDVSSYAHMFEGCSSLTTAPELSATTLATRCYQYMFLNCSKLNYIKANFIDYINNDNQFNSWVQGVSSTGTFVMNPNATYNPNNIRGYNGIPSRWTVVYSDNNNNSNNNEVTNTKTITTTIDYNHITILPATELAPNCYHHMFTSCKSLKSIPELPADNLTNYCYHGMFMDCDGINKATLSAQYLAPHAYSNMFLGSDNLSDVTVTYNENVDETNYKGWLKGVTTNGKFTYNHPEEVDDKLIRSNYYVPSTWGIKYRNPNINYFYIEDISGEPNVFSINKIDNGIAAPELNLEYSTDKQNWLVLDGNSIEIPANSKVYLRGNNDGTGVNKIEEWPSGYNTFTCSGQYNVGGNIMSLLYSDECMVEDTLTNTGTFMSLFEESTTLVNAKDLILPATTLTNYCYYSMFTYCTSLTTAPELPATTLADWCYGYMFYGTNVLPDCSNIDFTSETVVQSGGLIGLFGGTKVTDEDLMNILPINPETNHYYLPVMNLGNYCYQYMFYGCNKLTTAPELPATTLAQACYFNMFEDCTSLTTAPELPATTLANSCYSGMFSNCSSLTSAPELPATTLANSCYSYMFWSCTSLTTAPELPATTLANYCYSGMFQGCTSLTTAPSILPATTLTSCCYRSMFEGCSSLTTAPELPAPTLVLNCYTQMFYGCSKLNYIKADFINYSFFSNNNQSLSHWVNGVSSTGTFVMNPNATYNPDSIRGVDGIPTGWTVTTK